MNDSLAELVINWLYLIQNSRHYKKISGDGDNGFNLVRLPLYKYSKGVKEKFFQDNVMSFYWLYFRAFNDVAKILSEKNTDED